MVDKYNGPKTKEDLDEAFRQFAINNQLANVAKLLNGEVKHYILSNSRGEKSYLFTIEYKDDEN